MRRYSTRPTAGKPLYIETPLWGDVEPHRPTLDVPGHTQSFTGLYDARGGMIFRDPNPMGFCADL